MSIDQEKLMAYVDGQLPADEMARVAAEIESDGEARAYVERQQALSQRLQASFDDILDQPVPERLRPPAPRPSWISWPRIALWSGLPTALAFGLLVGLMLNSGSDIVSDNGGLVARGDLARALTEKLAAEDRGAARIGLSFRDKNGRYCRTFNDKSVAGVACRENGDWRIAATASAAAEPSGEYRQAGSPMPDAVRAAVTAMIEGEPLTAEGERQARRSGWK